MQRKRPAPHPLQSILTESAVSSSEHVRELLEFATTVAQEAGALTLRHFGGLVNHEAKGDGSPVTIADREAEELIRKRVEQRFPEHSILGEEYESPTRVLRFGGFSTLSTAPAISGAACQHMLSQWPVCTKVHRLQPPCTAFQKLPPTLQAGT